MVIWIVVIRVFFINFYRVFDKLLVKFLIIVWVIKKYKDWFNRKYYLGLIKKLYSINGEKYFSSFKENLKNLLKWVICKIFF